MSSVWRVGFGVALLSTTLAACSDGGGTAADGGSEGIDATTAPVDGGGGGVDSAVDPTGDVTWYEDVRPVVTRQCLGCHTMGGIGPFPLQEYAQAMPLSGAMAAATGSRRMPPFLADNSGDCQTYRDAHWLSADEIEIFRQWDLQGAPIGDPSTPPPTPPVHPMLTGDVASIDIGVDYTPGTAANDDYRCFLVEAPRGGFATGYQVHPGNPRIVHHVIVYEPQDDAAGQDARDQDAAEAGPGYTCFGGAGVDAFPVVLWAPGGGATLFPRGTGVEVSPTRPLVVQVHYNVAAERGSSDRTTVDIQFADSATPAYLVPIVDSSFSLPPRMPSVSSERTMSLGRLPLAVRVYGSFPHMHQMGRQLEVDVMREGGEEECLVRVPRWDFNWQLAYWYENPVTVERADQIRIQCTWDTSSTDSTTTWGEGTADEMCLNFVYVSL